MTSGMINAYTPGQVALPTETEAMIARRQRLLGPAYRLFYQTPLHLVRGAGVYLYDRDGREYLDCYNNVASVGHCHPHVVAATARQSAVYASHTRYLNDTVLDYAERLLTHFPPDLSQVMFTCTGSEANDLALRVASAHTGGSGVIVTANAYHGVTEAISAMSPSLGAGVPLGQNVRTIPAPNPANMTGDLGAAFAAAVQTAIDDLLAHGIKPCALLVDTVFSSDGIFTDPPGFLTDAVATIRAAGGIFIADEVQPGFGRTGSAMWGFQRHGVSPDLVTLGKPMGNGYPVAGLVMCPEVVAEFGAKARYFNTFGGNAVAAATAMAVLDVIENEALQANAAKVGGYLRDGLKALAKTHDSLCALRSAGLFLGQDIVTDGTPDAAKTSCIVNALRDAGILISATGPMANTLKIRPPLVFATAHADRFLASIAQVLRQSA